MYILTTEAASWHREVLFGTKRTCRNCKCHPVYGVASCREEVGVISVITCICIFSVFVNVWMTELVENGPWLKK